MFNWIRRFWATDANTKNFILNWILYGLMIIASTIYVYARLDYVRSAPKAKQSVETPIPK